MKYFKKPLASFSEISSFCSIQNLQVSLPTFFGLRYRMQNRPKVSEFFHSDAEAENLLLQYVKSLSPETVNHLSKPTSSEVFQVMERNIVGLLGNLPPEQFGVTITTNRESLGRLLASAMISGYFLRNAEQRMNFSVALQGTATDNLETE